MLKISLIFVLFAASLIAESVSQHIILPTYRPPVHRPVIIRTVRSAADSEPQWLYAGDDVIRAPSTADHPTLPKYIDDIKIDPNIRVARSVDSPSAKRGGGSGTRSSGSRNTGATHPGYNRRNARDIRQPSQPFRPFTPLRPSPYNPNPNTRYPTRYARDVSINGIRKPTHHDVIIPNWNPNARIKPWQTIGVKNH